MFVYLGTRYTIVGLVVITELKLGSLSSTPSTPNISSTEMEKYTFDQSRRHRMTISFYKMTVVTNNFAVIDAFLNRPAWSRAYSDNVIIYQCA